MRKIFLLLTLLAIVAITFYLVSRSSQFNLLSDPKTESGLRNRYEALVNLEKNKNFAEIYDQFLSQEEREKISKENYLSDRIAAEKAIDEFGIVSSEYVINKVVIENDIGFIDRTIVFCQDANCGRNVTRRGYKKWIYQNNHWYSTSESPYCIKDAPYSRFPEFDRAISLLSQRLQAVGEGFFLDEFINCVDIEYSDNIDAEGVFFFDSDVSSLERLVIHVNSSYKAVDDLTTAILLVHELTHANQYITYLYNNEPQNCIDQEVDAFYAQYIFVRTLNDEERSSILTRLYIYPGVNNQIQIIKDLGPINARAESVCSTNMCYIDTFKKGIKKWVESNSYYQEQCDL